MFFLVKDVPHFAPIQPSGAGGLLPYHLEDIDSDDDSLLQEEYDKKLSKSPTPVPMDSPAAPSPPASTPPMKKQPSKTVLEGLGGSPMPSKEELLMMMEKVDRDIAAAETQISALEKKRVCVFLQWNQDFHITSVPPNTFALQYLG